LTSGRAGWSASFCLPPCFTISSQPYCIPFMVCLHCCGRIHSSSITPFGGNSERLWNELGRDDCKFVREFHYTRFLFCLTFKMYKIRHPSCTSLKLEGTQKLDWRAAI
jgi:hypothetical protein